MGGTGGSGRGGGVDAGRAFQPRGTIFTERRTEEACQLLGLIGLTPRCHQENRRTSYTFGPVRLEIDAWPRIPPYLEIEADDAAQVLEAAAALGIDREQVTSVNPTKVYALYGIDLGAIADLRFPCPCIAARPPATPPMSLTSGGLGGALPEEARDDAVRRLQEAYASGALTYEEMDRRLGRALATGTAAELDAVVAGLPAEAPASTGAIVAAAGRITRRGAWRVPRFLKVGSALGRVRLDLSRAVFDGPGVEIALELGTGGARIIVPRDAVVELDGVTTGWKDLRYRPRQPSRPGGPVVRVTGTVGFGRLRVRHAWFRRREQKEERGRER